MRKIHIIGGGTVAHIRPHLAISAPAYGAVVRELYEAVRNAEDADDYIVHLYTTKMAGNRHQIWTNRSGIDDVEPDNLETNADIARLLETICKEPEPSVVFLPAALCDYEVSRIDDARGVPSLEIGKQYKRLRTDDGAVHATLQPALKIIGNVRKTRKDIFLVGFKTTTGAEKQTQFNEALTLMKKSSCNLVLANDLVTRLNMVVTPEQAPYYVSTDRRHTLRQLVGMALVRSKGHFTRSEVDYGAPLIKWRGEVVPQSLRTVVDHCIKRGAYKPFMGKTVGHFAFKIPTGPGVAPTFVTSRRGVDFNQLDSVGMVNVIAEGTDKVIAMGGKPSVGGQSQRIIFANHPDVDCIVHFHCPLRPGFTPRMPGDPHTGFPVRPQGPYECGSHECGQNTSDGLETFIVDKNGYQVKAVMLDKHGPNIVFDRRVDPHKVIEFIERYWDLDHSTSEVP